MRSPSDILPLRTLSDLHHFTPHLRLKLPHGRSAACRYHGASVRPAWRWRTSPVVGGDFSFYSIPDGAFWKKVFDPAPPQLKWDLKVPEEFRAKRFSHQARYGACAGQENLSFLDAELFRSGFIEPLSACLDRIGVFLIEFGTFSKATYPEPKAFCDDLNGEGIPRADRAR